MGFPYRTPATIDPENVTAPLPALDRWLRAVSLATVIFLLTAAAMMITLMRDLAGLRFSSSAPAPTRAPQAALHEPAPKAPPPPKAPTATR